MHLVSLALSDFRCFSEAVFEPDPQGTTVITGDNGVGKTSLLEAVGYVASSQSFRGAQRETLVRAGAEHAVLRAQTVVGERSLLVEAELSRTGRSRTQLNRQPVRRREQLHEALYVTVFSPEDIGMVREGPAARRQFLDGVLTTLDPRAAAYGDDVDRVLRQRAALLRQAGGRQTAEIEATLDVWDARLVMAGLALTEAREALVDQLRPVVARHYARLAGADVAAGLAYQRSWHGAFADALAASRRDDLRRATTLVGPHRDDLVLTVAGLPARMQASQGEQRSLALALRLAAHELTTERLGSPPVLLLDDVFSELDPSRSRALLAGLAPGQAFLTTALPPPPEVAAARTLRIVRPGVLDATPPRAAL